MPPRGRKLAAVPAGRRRERPPDLRDAVRAALEGMDWLRPSDGALKALAVRQAEEIEKAVERAEELAELRREFAGDMAALRRLQKLEAMCEVTKTVGWLGPQLQGVLRDLGGTPAARAAMKADKPIGGRLAQLRADAAGQHDS
ncbi:hypothetical protein [Spongiactinospora sp. TRM90649]|uniref:terminase small subunit n=1 Tax=Spongiactinospora sp. TRM90649 TaxID=3031114 RepID=UPI0023F99EEF|nr:hypothetical protein [Spongiactinospora sp. TRM90649]MDF5755810.1 hypothetical protein [Spongiactinospora sp. TRM90649]